MAVNVAVLFFKPKPITTVFLLVYLKIFQSSALVIALKKKL